MPCSARLFDRQNDVDDRDRCGGAPIRRAPVRAGARRDYANGMAFAEAYSSEIRVGGRSFMELYWVPIGFGVVVLLLVLLLARLVGNSQRRKIRKQLGLPVDSKLSPQEAQAFRAFEDTDMRLKKSFPTISDTQRQAMAREVLRDKGVLAKKKKTRSG